MRHNSPFSYYEQEMLKGLRGKDRAKMVYAIEQSHIHQAHTMALFDDYALKVRPKLEKYLDSKNKQISAVLDRVFVMSRKLQDGIKPILAPYVVSFPPSAGASISRTNAQDILDAASWVLQRETSTALQKQLHEYRIQLGNKLPPVNPLSPEEQAEVIKAITPKLLPANTTPTLNSKNEIEVG